MKSPCDKTSDRYESEASTDGSILTTDSNQMSEMEHMKKQYRLLQLESDMHRSKLALLSAELGELRKITEGKMCCESHIHHYTSKNIIKKSEDYRDKLQNVSDFYDKEEEDLLNSISKKVRAYTNRNKIRKNSSIDRDEFDETIHSLKRTIEEKQLMLQRLQEDKVNINNQLEQEQEFLYNRLCSNLTFLESNIKSFKSDTNTLLNSILNKCNTDEISNMDLAQLKSFIKNDLSKELEKLKNTIRSLPEEAPTKPRQTSISSSHRSRHSSTSLNKSPYHC